MRTALLWAIMQRVVIIPYLRSGTTSQSHLQASRIHSWPLNMAPIGCPEPWVWNYHYSSRNNPEKRSSQKEDTNLCLTFNSVMCICWCTHPTDHVYFCVSSYSVVAIATLYGAGSPEVRTVVRERFSLRVQNVSEAHPVPVEWTTALFTRVKVAGA